MKYIIQSKANIYKKKKNWLKQIFKKCTQKK